VSAFPVRIGQVWQSSDVRHRGRQCRVVAIEEPCGHVAVLENTATGRRTTILTDRLRGRFHWRLIAWHTATVSKESGEDATPNTEVR